MSRIDELKRLFTSPTSRRERAMLTADPRKLLGLLPPGQPTRVITHKDGKPIQVFRHLWIDRDKYSPLRGVAINGNEEARPEARPAAEEAAAEGEAEVAGRQDQRT